MTVNENPSGDKITTLNKHGLNWSHFLCTIHGQAFWLNQHEFTNSFLPFGIPVIPKGGKQKEKRKNFQRELTSNHSALNSPEGIWRCSKYLPFLCCQQVISCMILFYGLTCFLKFLWFFSHGISPYSTEGLGLRYRMKGLRFRGNCFIPQLGLLLITRNKQSHWMQEK